MHLQALAHQVAAARRLTSKPLAVNLLVPFLRRGIVETIAGLTFAEYARKGFFELVWATAFVVPVLLGGDWIVRGASATGLRWFRVSATTSRGANRPRLDSASLAAWCTRAG